MSINPANTETSSSQTYNLIWPDNLDDIKITEEEKNVLQSKIESLLQQLPSNTSSKDLYGCRTRSSSCPRRILVNHVHYFVMLNNHGGMPNFGESGAQQKKIKYIWDCYSGSFWLKKRYATYKQGESIKYIKYGLDIGKSSMGFPEIVFDYGASNGKPLYFEKMATMSLPKWIDTYGCKLNGIQIVGLLHALRKIHLVQYNPPSFSYADRLGYCNFDTIHTLFHGDISPNNIICEKPMNPDTEDMRPRLMLTDFFGIGDLNRIYWTKGWASPETIQFAVTRTKYQDLKNNEFLAKYGAKKDTWAMGLLIGSLLRGGFLPQYKQRLPFFSFIANKLKYDSENQYVVDESGLADLTQEEIDSKIDALIENSENDFLKVFWGIVKKYLIIDPDKRPTLAGLCVDMN